MPKDKNGAKLHVGDTVMLPCTVTGITPEGALNIMVESQEAAGKNVKTALLLNSSQVILKESLGNSALDIDISTAIHDSAMLKAAQLQS